MQSVNPFHSLSSEKRPIHTSTVTLVPGACGGRKVMVVVVVVVMVVAAAPVCAYASNLRGPHYVKVQR